jgi:hypothetical protein
VGLAEGDLALYDLGGARHDEKRVAVLLDFWMLMRFACILDRQVVEAKLCLQASQELMAGLEQSDPNDMPWPCGPLPSLVDGDVSYAPPARIHARGDDTGLG